MVTRYSSPPGIWTVPKPQIQEGGAALMFASEFFTPQITQLYGYGLEVSHFWISEMVDEPYPFICEYNMPLCGDTRSWIQRHHQLNCLSSLPQGPFHVLTTDPFTSRSPSRFVSRQLRECLVRRGRRGGARPAVPQQFRNRGRFAQNRAQRYGYRYPVLP